MWHFHRTDYYCVSLFYARENFLFHSFCENKNFYALEDTISKKFCEKTVVEVENWILLIFFAIIAFLLGWIQRWSPDSLLIHNSMTVWCVSSNLKLPQTLLKTIILKDVSPLGLHHIKSSTYIDNFFKIFFYITIVESFLA